MPLPSPLDHDEILNFLRTSSVFSLGFSVDDIRDLLERFPPTEISAGTMLATEGGIPQFLQIPLNFNADLLSGRPNAGNERIGEISPGRAFNLYSIVRGFRHQYAARAKSDGHVLQIPIAVFLQFFIERPELKTYLIAMTGDNEVRRIATQLRDLGCQKDFSVSLIASLERQTIEPQIWLGRQNELPDCALYIVSGDIQVFQTAGERLRPSWILPQRVWISISELANNEALRQSMRTVSTCDVLKFSADALRGLAEKYPSDLERIIRGDGSATSSIEDVNEDDEIEDVADLFKDALPIAGPKIFKYPWVAQNDQSDCGPACMTMLSIFYGKKTSIQFWRSHLNTNKEGTSLFDLATVSERFGFISHGLGIESFEDLDTSLLPCIVLRNYHYMVLYKIEGDDVVLGDPGVGIRKMTKQDFYAGFAKVALFLKPNDEFAALPESSSVYRHYFALFGGLRTELALTIFCSTLLVVFSLFPAILNQVFFDEVLTRRDTHLLLLALVAGGVYALLDGALTWTKNYYLTFLISKFDFRSHSAFLKKTLSLPYAFFAVRHTGDFTRRIGELERVRNFITGNLVNLFLSFVTLAIYLGFLTMYSPKLTVLLLLLIPGFFIISMFFSKSLKLQYGETFFQTSEQDGLITDLIKGVAAIKSLGAEVAARWRYEEKVVRSVRSKRLFGLKGATQASLVELYYQLVKLAMLGYTIELALNNELSIGQVIALTMITNQVIQPFFVIANQWAELQEMKMILSRLNDVFLTPSENHRPSFIASQGGLRGEIEFRDVWFRYGGDGTDWVLKGVSFKFDAGQKVAIVGPSGSGKSTIGYLLTRLYEPTKGQILIDGKDYRDYDVGWLRSKIGLLLQESHLFQGTVFENIGFKTAEPVTAHIVEAANQAVADEFIREKPSGYEYYIPNGGIGLSGGEKQRVTLARTLYSRPDILILDEATSALDNISERELLQNLRSGHPRSTLINIAHRFSTVMASDFGLVLNKGRVHGFGSLEELASGNSLFKEMFPPNTSASHSGQANHAIEDAA